MKATHTNHSYPVFCPNCEKQAGEWIARTKQVEQEFRGETFNVTADVLLCASCHYEYWNDQTAEKIVNETWNAYRRKNGLLFPKEIIHLRKSWEMTQKEFAEFLGVGEASIKRWERGLVQDKSQDQLIRAKAKEHGSRLTLYIPSFTYQEQITVHPGACFPLSTWNDQEIPIAESLHWKTAKSAQFSDLPTAPENTENNRDSYELAYTA